MDDISQYFGYVEYLVKKKYNHLNYPTVSLDDLVQEGKVGLIEAAQRYDKSMDVPFLSFAKLRIEGAIRDCLRRADSLSQADRAKLKSLQTAKDRLE